MKPDLLELRYKRPTQKEKGHRQIILKREESEDQVLGYLIKDMDVRGYMRWYVCWGQDTPYQNTNFKGSHEGRRLAIKHIAQTLHREGRKFLVMEAVLIEGHDNALIGLASRCGGEPVALYDPDIIIDNLHAQGMVQEDAKEFFEFNIEGSYMGEHTPMFLTKLEEE
jgi:hypothetical protein